MKATLYLTQLLLIRFFRQPAVLFWAVIFPIALSIILGIAFSRPPAPIRVGVLAPPLIQSSHITWVQTTPQTLSSDRIKGAFSVFLETKGGRWELEGDPAHPDVRMATLAIQQASSPYSFQKIHLIERPSSRYINFLLPGLIALSVMNSSLWGIGYAIIDMRSKRMLRRLHATPLGLVSLLSAHVISRLLIGLFEMGVLLLMGYWLFNVSVQGSVLALLMVVFSGTIAFSGVAVLVGSRTDSSVVGNGLINAVSLPMMIASGIFFSYRSFPERLVSIIEWLPLTTLADSLRLVCNEPVGIHFILVPSAVLMTCGVLGFLAGMAYFKW